MNPDRCICGHLYDVHAAVSEEEDRRGQTSGGCVECDCPGFKPESGDEEPLNLEYV